MPHDSFSWSDACVIVYHGEKVRDQRTEEMMGEAGGSVSLGAPRIDYRTMLQGDMLRLHTLR